MMLKPKRLQSFLKSDGFQLSHWSKEENLVLYSRPTDYDGVFEHIQIWCRGKMGEVASVRAECVAGWGIAREFIGESELITELGPNSNLEYEFTSNEDVELWERRVAEIAPMKCRELTNRVGADLEKKTREARVAARKYLSFWNVKGEEELREVMRSRSTEAQITQAGKLARLPRVVLSFYKQEFYTDIILGLMHDSPKIDGRNIIESPWTTDWMDPTYQRIELIADRLLHPEAFRGEFWAEST